MLQQWSVTWKFIRLCHCWPRRVGARPHACLQVWNPGFDVTPAHLITGIVSERGLIPKSADVFEVSSVATASPDALEVNGVAEEHKANGTAEAESATPEGFRALDVDSIKPYLAGIPHLARQLGPKTKDWQASLTQRCSCCCHSGQHTPASSMSRASVAAHTSRIALVQSCKHKLLRQQAAGVCMQVREVGDGNMNFVYIVEGPQGGLVVKQALPFIRIAPDWRITQVRCLPCLASPLSCLGCLCIEWLVGSSSHVSAS